MIDLERQSAYESWNYTPRKHFDSYVNIFKVVYAILLITLKTTYSLSDVVQAKALQEGQQTFYVFN